MALAVVIRGAAEDDAEAMLEIYAPIVQSTAISFESDVPSRDEFAARIRKYATGWAWLVAEHEGRVLGYAYGSPHRERPAYRWSTETSAYVAPEAKRKGVGTALYSALLLKLSHAGFCNAYAGIALPNEASVALHLKAGFTRIGMFPAVGHKFGRWHDVAWFHCKLRDQPPLQPSQAANAT